MDNGCRILMTAMGMEIGGAETHILELSCELKKRGYDVYVASNGGVYTKELEKNGIRHFSLPLHNKLPHNMIKSYFGLKKIIKDEKIDIVHSHARIPSFITGILHKQMKFPFITSAHWVFNTDGGLKYITNWGQKCVAVSNDIKKYLEDNYNYPTNDITVTINGIDTEKFSENTDASDVAAEFDLSEDKKRIVYVSRMDEDRSLVAFQLTEIALKLSEEIKNLEIVIVGGGNSFEALKAKVSEVNEKAGFSLIKLTGARTDINKFVKCATVFVGVSRAALEAMAASKPSVIAGNEGYIGIFDEDKLDISIKTNFCCRDCSPSDTDKLFSDLIYLLKNCPEEEFLRLKKYCRDTILEKYSVKKMTDDYVSAYNALLCEKNMRSDIVISGYYGYKNNGDDALLCAIINDLREISIHNTICVLSDDPKETEALYGVKSIHRYNPFKVCSVLKNAKLLISGGGSLIQDATSSQSLWYYLKIISLAQKYRIKTMLYANGIGPLNKKSDIKRAEKVLKNIDLITLREPTSLNELDSMNIDRAKIQVLADPAFGIEPKEDIGDVLKSFSVPEDKKLLAISVRTWKKHASDFEAVMANAVDALCEKYDMVPLFLNMQYPSDVKMSRKIASLMKNQSYSIEKILSGAEMLGIIKKCDFVLAERLHVLIYAAAVRTPLLAIVYDPKVKSFMEYIGLDSYIDVEKADSDLIVSMAENNFDKVSDVSGKMRVLAKRNADLAIKLLKR